MNRFRKTYNKVRSVFKNNEEAHIDESDSLILSLGFFLMFFSWYVIGGSFRDPGSFVIPDFILLPITIFSLYFLLVMQQKRGSIKSILLVFTFTIVVVISMILYSLNPNMDELNNGLSLLALSFTLIFMPVDKEEKKYAKEKEEMNQKSIETRDKMIEELLKENKRLGKSLTDVGKEFEAYQTKIESQVDSIESKITELREDIDSHE